MAEKPIHPHLNGKTPAQKIMMESAGLTAAEVVSSVLGMTVVGVADKIAPGMVDKATKSLAKNFYEPHLDKIEKTMRYVCHLQECKSDPNEPKEVRAERLARTTVLFGAAFVPSLLAKIMTRRGVNELCGMGDNHAWWNPFFANKHDRGVVYWDEGVHFGSMLLLNTGLAKQSDELLRSADSMLQKFGMSPRKAHELASMAVVWELPNAIGLAAGVGKIIHRHTSAIDPAHILNGGGSLSR